MPIETEQEAYHQLISWTLTLNDSEFIHQHVVDAWAAQHATKESASISVYFALLGLYLHLEKGYTGRQVQRAHMQIAQPHGRGPGRREWTRFPLPTQRGSITVADVLAAPEKERRRAVDLWCQGVWEAWKHNHTAIAECVSRDLSV